MTHDSRLERFIAGMGPSLGRQFIQYNEELRKNSSTVPFPWGETPEEAYWRDLPRWLAGKKNGRRVSPGILDALVWGQTCLFYAVRMQDDLLDGKISRSGLALAPLLFLTEADRAFSSAVARNAKFWAHYRHAVGATVGGIVRVAEMQRDFRKPARELLHAYGTVDAIFTVGPAAVCERIGRPEWIRRIEVFVSELGKVLLSLDDLEDIDEDLADGRLTYPARLLLGSAPLRRSGRSILEGGWREDVRPAAYDRIRKPLRECLRRAAKAVAPLSLEPVSQVLEQANQAVENIGGSC